MAYVPKKIRTPLKQQWRQFRHRFLPVVVFSATVLSTVILWQRHAGPSALVGAVEKREADVASPVSSDILEFALGENNVRFDVNSMVQEGQVVVVLDSVLLDKKLDVAQAKLLQSIEEVAAEREKIAGKNRDLDQDRKDEKQKQLSAKEKFVNRKGELVVNIQDRKTDINVAEIEIRRARKELDVLVKTAGQLAIEQKQLRVQALEKRLAEERLTLETEQEQLVRVSVTIETLEKAMAAPPLSKHIDVDTAIRPYQQAVEVDRKRVEELRQEKTLYEIRAPFAGQITAIHKWPGQSVEPSDVIFTVTSVGVEYITAYLRQSSPYRPQAGDVVAVRMRTRPPLVDTGSVTQVGAKFEPVPLDQLRNPRIPEWGLPVRITVSRKLAPKLKPGELVDLTFAGAASDTGS
jgi:multidrug efflux pump subunit AcrA (membrane-fusion protein)